MIDQGQGGSKIVRANRKVEWKIVISGYPRPQVTWSKGDDPECFSLLSGGSNGVRIYEEELLHLDVANAVLSIGKCKVRYLRRV